MTCVVNREMGVELENSEVNAFVSRLTALQEVDGNPMGVDIQKFGDATAFSVTGIPGPSFNTVKGLTDQDKEYVGDIIHFYGKKKIPVRFELTPAHVSSELLAYLHKLGFYQVDFHTSLYKEAGSAIREENAESNISIRELERDEFDTFAEIYVNGFGMPSFLKSGVAKNNEILHNKPDWTFYLASADNVPAGIGVLHMKDGIAMLAAAATVPSLRNKGVHSALINKRISQASLQECKLITGQAKFGSASQNNMEKAGMRIAYTKAIWVKE